MAKLLMLDARTIRPCGTL